MVCLLCPRGDKSNYFPNLITCWQTPLGPMWCKWHTTARWVNTTSPGASMITRAKVVTAGRKQCWGPTHLRAAESSPLLLSPLLVSSWIRNPNHTSKSPTCFCLFFFWTAECSSYLATLLCSRRRSSTKCSDGICCSFLSPRRRNAIRRLASPN